jgi:hypothetical protein
MAEGLSAPEVGKELAEHARHSAHTPHERNEQILSIAEAVLLSIVTVTAAWSGYAAAKWSTESSVALAEASAARATANRADLSAMQLREFDASTFNAWFAAYTAGNQRAMAVAAHRFRPEFRVAFDAWRATNPETNPNAPRGPTYMPQYRQPGLARAVLLGKQADDDFDRGASAGATSDKYIRTTVFLASVLFLAGISSHFRLTRVRHALVALGAVLLVVSLVQLVQLPAPP